MVKKYQRKVQGFGTQPAIDMDEVAEWNFLTDELNRSYADWEIEFVVKERSGYVIFLRREIPESQTSGIQVPATLPPGDPAHPKQKFFPAPPFRVP